MNIYIYGTGSGAEKLYAHKLKEDVEVMGFLDSDSHKWGKKVPFASQYTVMGIKDITKPYDMIVIASIYEEIYYYLLENNISISKILIVNEETNNHMQNTNNRQRYLNLENILQEKYLHEFAKIEHLFPQGNYSSAVVDTQYIRENEEKIFRKDLPEESGIDLHLDKQLALLHQFSEQGDILPFADEKQEQLRFYGNNDMFHTPSAHVLSHMITTFHTKRIIEAGSGFSSAAMLDVNEKVLGNKVRLTFIEPYPNRLRSILKETDTINLLECKLQEIELDVFSQLESGDILFIDSSHVCKTGSDVNYIIFEILPILKMGVIIHFHDIFFPFEYSKKWVYEGRGWTEGYLLQAFLQYNEKFEIIYWDNCLWQYNKSGRISLQSGDDEKLLVGGSLYIQKSY